MDIRSCVSRMSQLGMMWTVAKIGVLEAWIRIGPQAQCQIFQ